MANGEVCAKCGRPLPGDAGICGHCGARFARFGPTERPDGCRVVVALGSLLAGLFLTFVGGSCSIGVLTDPPWPGLVLNVALFVPSVAFCLLGFALCVRSVRRLGRRRRT